MSKYADYVKKKIVPQIRCRRCHHAVLTSELDSYPFQCVACEEDLYGIETVWSDEPVSEREIDYLAECVRNEGLIERRYSMYKDAVLLSVKPKWCELIASGDKTVEIRKTKPKIDVPFTCYIYCTLGSGTLDLLWTGKDCTIGKLGDASNGKIIGEFVCDRIDTFKVFEDGLVQNWNFADLSKSGLSYDETAQYIGRGKTGYAWHISKLIVYPKPMELSALSRCRKCQYYDTCDESELSCSGEYAIITPPMSWCYCGPI